MNNMTLTCENNQSEKTGKKELSRPHRFVRIVERMLFQREKICVSLVYISRR